MDRQRQLDKLESYFSQRDQLDPTISKVDVAWHLDHSLKVINRIYDRLNTSDPGKYRWRPNLLRTVVFATGIMMRGRGKAPRLVTPPDQINDSDLEQQLREAKEKLQALSSLPSRSFFYHYAFGNLNRDQAARFIEIHTEHHLDIIKDIIDRGDRT